MTVLAPLTTAAGWGRTRAFAVIEPLQSDFYLTAPWRDSRPTHFVRFFFGGGNGIVETVILVEVADGCDGKPACGCSYVLPR